MSCAGMDPLWDVGCILLSGALAAFTSGFGDVICMIGFKH